MVEMFKSILSDVNVNKCRGTVYDGASVMSGKMSGVQKRMQDNATVINALYVHCCADNLNLVLSDAAEAKAEVKTFFGVIQEIDNYLGAVLLNGQCYRLLVHRFLISWIKTTARLLARNLVQPGGNPNIKLFQPFCCNMLKTLTK
jgi:hypothetical protein